jgi:aminocarboxymuconate-semialdehyde decarboxylase
LGALVYADTSLYTAASVRSACDFRGADRLLFGTDAPFDATGGRYSVRASLEAIDASARSEEEQRRMLHGNAERFFGLPP